MAKIYKFKMPDRPGDLGVKNKLYDVIDIHTDNGEKYRYIVEKKILIRVGATYKVGFPEKIVPENSAEYRGVISMLLAWELTNG